MGDQLFNPDFAGDGSHLNASCSYAEYVGNKLYEYVAVIKLIKELATSEDARKSLWESFMDSALGHAARGDMANYFAGMARDSARSHTDAAATGSFEDWVNQIGHDWFNYSLPWAQDGSAKAWHERMAREDKARAETLEAVASQEYATAKEKLKAFFEALWKAIEQRWRECGFLYAASTTATDAVFVVADLALGAGLSAAARTLLKSLKFTVHISLPAAGAAVASAGAEGLKVTKDTLISVTAIVGVPGSVLRKITRTYKAGDLDREFHLDDTHAGGHAEDPQAPIKDKPDDKKKLSSKAIGDKAEEQARKKLHDDGYKDQRVIQNPQGNGVDVMARNPKTGDVAFAEVKANGARLSPDQAYRGGPDYVRDRLKRVVNQKGEWAGATQAQMDDAQDVLDWFNGNEPSFKEIKYDVDPETGDVSNYRERDWNYSPGQRPEDLKWRDDKGNEVTGKGKPKKPPSTGPPLGR